MLKIININININYTNNNNKLYCDFEPSGRTGTFVGYNESSKAYRIYIPSERQIEVSKDVTFEKEEAF